MSDSAETTHRVFTTGPVAVTWRPAGRPFAAPAAPQAPELLRSAQARLAQGDRPAALADAQRAVGLEPDNVEAIGLAAALAFELGDHDLAERLFARAAGLMPAGSPEQIHVKSLRALALAHARRWSQAAGEAAEASSSGAELPGNVEWRLGRVMGMINRADRGVEHLRRAVMLEPGRPEHRCDYGDSLRDLGDFAGAEREYESAIAIDPGAGRAHSGLAHLRRWSREANHLARLARVVQSGELSDLDKSYVCYALFKECDDLGDAGAAWASLTRANELAARAAGGAGAVGEAIEFDQLKTGFPPSAFEASPSSPAPSGRRRPIFVTGLPRSGTTLVERILGAHSQVAPIGETPMFSRLFRPAWERACMAAGPAAAADRIDWSALAQGYLDETEFLAEGAPYSVDKMPDNLLLAGPIRRAFPEAVIVLVVRAPMDVLFGCYKAPLVFPWSRRLDDLLAHYGHVSELTAHWRRALGDGLIVVEYERLVSDPETQIPGLLQRCGLDVEAACSRPHETPGAVASSSSTQVRSPITRERIGAWRRYERQLEGLRRGLAAIGAVVD